MRHKKHSWWYRPQRRSEKVSLVTGFPQGGAPVHVHTRATLSQSPKLSSLFTCCNTFFADESQIYKSFPASSNVDQKSRKPHLGIALVVYQSGCSPIDSTRIFHFVYWDFYLHLFYITRNIAIHCTSSQTEYGQNRIHQLWHSEAIRQSMFVRNNGMRWYNTGIPICGTLFIWIKNWKWNTMFLLFYSISIDFCNSLLFWISDETLDRLLKVQNAAARLIYGLTKTTIWPRP